MRSMLFLLFFILTGFASLLIAPQSEAIGLFCFNGKCLDTFPATSEAVLDEQPDGLNSDGCFSLFATNEIRFNAFDYTTIKVGFSPGDSSIYNLSCSSDNGCDFTRVIAPFRPISHAKYIYITVEDANGLPGIVYTARGIKTEKNAAVCRIANQYPNPGPNWMVKQWDPITGVMNTRTSAKYYLECASVFGAHPPYYSQPVPWGYNGYQGYSQYPDAIRANTDDDLKYTYRCREADDGECADFYGAPLPLGDVGAKSVICHSRIPDN